MEKKSYVVPELELCLLRNEDIVTTSGNVWNLDDDGAQPDFF